MTKHTPGEWTYRKPFGMNSMYHTFIKDGDGCIFARVDSRASDFGSVEAAATACDDRARLISAAPDLLAACEAGLDLSMYAAALNWDGSPNTPEFLADLAAKIEAFQPLARAAIAKAKGETLCFPHG